ncbi:MAG: hypothetical protein V1779_06890 [bacterium]
MRKYSLIIMITIINYFDIVCQEIEIKDTATVNYTYNINLTSGTDFIDLNNMNNELGKSSFPSLKKNINHLGFEVLYKIDSEYLDSSRNTNKSILKKISHAFNKYLKLGFHYYGNSVFDFIQNNNFEQNQNYISKLEFSKYDFLFNWNFPIINNFYLDLIAGLSFTKYDLVLSEVKNIYYFSEDIALDNRSVNLVKRNGTLFIGSAMVYKTPFRIITKCSKVESSIVFGMRYKYYCSPNVGDSYFHDSGFSDFILLNNDLPKSHSFEIIFGIEYVFNK